MNSVRRRPVLALTALSALALVACHKKPPEAPTVSESAAPAQAQVQTAAPAPAASEEQEALEEKKKALAEAMAENEILNDPKGQWAVDATASSADDDAKGQDSYSPWQVTGKPNVEHYGLSTDAWIAKTADSGIEWLKVDFANPVHASTIRIRQVLKPGAIVKIELLEANGSAHTIFQGVDDSHYEDSHIAWLQKTFDPTPYLVKSAKITLATNMVPGYNAIDAIQLVGQ